MDSDTRTRIIICDTEPVAMQGLASLLEYAPDLRVTGRTGSLAAAGSLLEVFSPAIAIVDRAFGIQAVSNWLASLGCGRQCGAVVWGSNIAGTEVPLLVRAGARGVIRKTADLEDLVACIREVASGGTWIQEFVPRRTPLRSPVSTLTSREQQVLELVERGLSNKQIGAMLGIGSGTVKIHIRHIFSKTGVRRRLELAIAGFRDRAVLALPPM